MKKLIVLALVLISAVAFAEITNHGISAGKSASAAVAAQPTCVVGLRGSIFNVEGASGAADVFQVCAKDAANAYGWATK